MGELQNESIPDPHVPQTEVSQIGHHRLSTRCAVVQRHHCGVTASSLKAYTQMSVGCFSSQVMTVRFASGTWRRKPASRKLQLTAKSSKNPSTMSLSIHQSLSLRASVPTALPRFSSNSSMTLHSSSRWIVPDERCYETHDRNNVLCHFHSFGDQWELKVSVQCGHWTLRVVFKSGNHSLFQLVR